MRAPIGDFDTVIPAPDCLDELTAPVADAVRRWQGGIPADRVLYVDTDPRWADTAVFVEVRARRRAALAARRPHPPRPAARPDGGGGRRHHAHRGVRRGPTGR